MAEQLEGKKDFSDAVEKAEALARSVGGIKPEDWQDLASQLLQNLSDDELSALSGLTKILGVYNVD